MRRTVEIAQANMSTALHQRASEPGSQPPSPHPTGARDRASNDPASGDLASDDRALADSFGQQIDDAAAYLELALHDARHIAEAAGTFADRAAPQERHTVPDPVDGSDLGGPDPAAPGRGDTAPARQRGRGGGHDAPRPAATIDAPAPVTIRMGFAVDVAGYSARPAGAKLDAQARTASIVGEVLRDMNLDIADTDHHGTGDGMIVFLPPSVEIHRVLPPLIRITASRLAADNRRYHDRLRLRLAAAVGPLGVAAIGFGNNTIVECARMVDSDAIKSALKDNPDADLAVLVSEELYSWVIGEGYDGLDPAEFRHVDVHVKDFDKSGWLWVT
jgi:hypothetical protein